MQALPSHRLSRLLRPLSARRATPPSVAAPSQPIGAPPRSLASIAEIASALALGDSVAAVLPDILRLVAANLDAGECALWLGAAPDGLRLAESVGTAATTATEVAALLAGEQRTDLACARLLAGRQPLGALTVRPGRALTSDDWLFLFTVGNVLAPSLRDAEYAHRLESEVDARTREIDAQRRFTEKIIDSLPVGLYVIDQEYRVQAWNRKREIGLQGVSRDDAIGRPIFDILHRQPVAMLRPEFDEVFATGEVQQFHMESRWTGEPRNYRITKIPMCLDDAAVTHVITIGEDVTEWRQAQDRFAQAEKLAAIGTLAAGVMHEINNPLATIGACAESLTAVLDDDPAAIVPRDELHEMLRLIQNEVDRCKHIVLGVLDFSRPRPAERALLDVNAAIERTLFLLKHHSRFKKLTVTVDLDHDLPPVNANEEQLVQVFLSLLLNAMDAMHERGTVTLRTRRDADMVVAEVIDEGEGIRSSEIPKIFEPFYTTKAPGRGTGLGLSICWAIVREHGGRIEVDSTPGRGSVFAVRLPVGSAGDGSRPEGPR